MELLHLKFLQLCHLLELPHFQFHLIAHGDLGRITKSDILILISNSGNTSELSNIISFSKKIRLL